MIKSYCFIEYGDFTSETWTIEGVRRTVLYASDSRRSPLYALETGNPS